MTILVETGLGLPNSVSYASVAEANARHGASTSADAWDAFDLPVKEQRLVTATRRLDTMFDWAGQPYLSSQALGFPRSMIRNSWGQPMYTREVPAAVKNATIDLALWLPEEVASSATTASSDVVQEVTLGPIGIKLATPSSSSTTTTTPSTTLIPAEIVMSLRRFGVFLGGNSGSVGRLVR